MCGGLTKLIPYSSPTLTKALLLIVVSAGLLIGCSEDNRDVDPTPEAQSGGPSGEFESEDIDAAESASNLVGIYCAGAESEAQEVGCLAHVSDSDVCELDTDGKEYAVDAYIDQTGEDPC